MTAEISPDVLAAAIEAAARARAEYTFPSAAGTWALQSEESRESWRVPMRDAIAAAAPIITAAVEAETELRFHVAEIAERGPGEWGVICAACSRAADDYVFPCRVNGNGYWDQMPESLVDPLMIARSVVPANPTEENR